MRMSQSTPRLFATGLAATFKDHDERDLSAFLPLRMIL